MEKRSAKKKPSARKKAGTSRRSARKKPSAKKPHEAWMRYAGIVEGASDESESIDEVVRWRESS